MNSMSKTRDCVNLVAKLSARILGLILMLVDISIKLYRG
jgi:hypothetical protein